MAQPSQSVEGLDRMAEKAAIQAKREEAKRRGGNKLDPNVALKVDDTGRRWSFQIKVGLALAALSLLGLILVALNYCSKKVDPQKAREETGIRLSDYRGFVRLMKPFENEEAVSAEGFRERLKESLQRELASLGEARESEKKSRGKVSYATREGISKLEKDLTFLDGFGHPLEFKSEGENQIAISSRKAEKSVLLDIPRKGSAKNIPP